MTELKAENFHLYKITARGCRDTFVVTHDIENALKVSKLRAEAVLKVEKLASLKVMDDKTGLLFIGNINFKDKGGK